MAKVAIDLYKLYCELLDLFDNPRPLGSQGSELTSTVHLLGGQAMSRRVYRIGNFGGLVGNAIAGAVYGRYDLAH